MERFKGARHSLIIGIAGMIRTGKLTAADRLKEEGDRSPHFFRGPSWSPYYDEEAKGELFVQEAW